MKLYSTSVDFASTYLCLQHSSRVWRIVFLFLVSHASLECLKCLRHSIMISPLGDFSRRLCVLYAAAPATGKAEPPADPHSPLPHLSLSSPLSLPSTRPTRPYSKTPTRPSGSEAEGAPTLWRMSSSLPVPPRASNRGLRAWRAPTVVVPSRRTSTTTRTPPCAGRERWTSRPSPPTTIDRAQSTRVSARPHFSIEQWADFQFQSYSSSEISSQASQIGTLRVAALLYRLDPETPGYQYEETECCTGRQGGGSRIRATEQC